MKKSIHTAFGTQWLKQANVKRFAVFMLLAAAFSVTLHAQNPKISIQGTLKNASGASVVDGTYNVTFKLYSVETGGTALWQEAAMVEVIGGIYSHYLGSVTPLNAANFANTLYLGVQVGSYELVPRSELAYSPYAFSVSSAQKVVCSGAVGDVKYSILNPTQFALENGDCWVPMKGQALATTDKLRQITGMTALPDAGGLFLRSQEFSGGADNDPNRDSNTAIATVQADGNKSHSHTLSGDGSHSHQIPYDSGGGGINYFGGPMLWFTNVSDQGVFHTPFAEAQGMAQTTYSGAHSHSIGSDGGSETRPKNLNLWIYIRIN